MTDQNNRLETLNLGTDLVPFDDDTDVSDADILGFDLKHEGTESEKYGDRNLMNDVIGAVPGELVIMNEDNEFSLTDIDYVTKFSEELLPDSPSEIHMVHCVPSTLTGTGLMIWCT